MGTKLKPGPDALFGEGVAMADAAGLDANADMSGRGVGECFLDELESAAGGGHLHGTALNCRHGVLLLGVRAKSCCEGCERCMNVL